MHTKHSTGSWRYRIEWTRHEPMPIQGQGEWLVIASTGSSDIADALGVAGVSTTVLNSVPDLLSDKTFRGVVAQVDDVDTAVKVVQAVGRAGIDAPLWIVTRGAVEATGGDEAAPAAAAVWGLGRVVGLEHPDRWGGLVDLPSELTPVTAAALVSVVHGRGGEDQVAVRTDGVYVRRLVRADSSSATRAWAPSGTVLVTGGTGGLGGHLARWLAGLGAEHLVLVSRRGGDAPGAASLEAELLGLGVGVTIAACDVADHDALAALIGRLAGQVPPVRTVVHAAGVGSPVPVDEITSVHAELAPKVAGVENLARLLGPQLDTFVLFSSGSGVWGSGMLGGYAAANAYLDAVAPVLRRRGVPATSVAWGAWAGDGMGADDVGRELRRRGILGMSPTRALHELRGVLERDETNAVIADIRWADFVPAFASRRDSPLLARIVAEIDGDETSDGSGALLTQLAGLPENERIKLLRQTVRQHAAAVLGYADPGEVRLDATFQEIGFDSIAVVGISRRLTEATGVRLAATAVFDHPTPDALATYLCEQLTARTDSGHPIDEVERWLTGISGDEVTDALARLESIANRLRGARTGVDLADATDDELFGLLDDELGRR